MFRNDGGSGTFSSMAGELDVAPFSAHRGKAGCFQLTLYLTVREWSKRHGLEFLRSASWAGESPEAPQNVALGPHGGSSELALHSPPD